MSIPQCIILEIPVNESIYDFDRVYMEILVENCIVGMLLTLVSFVVCLTTWSDRVYKPLTP